MSGGRWDYLQYRFTDVAEDIKNLVERNGKRKTEDEIKHDWKDSGWYENFPDDLFHNKYSDEVIEELKNGYEIISKAQVYMKRIDWLLSGDDGEENFLKRIKSDLDKIETLK